LAGGEQAGIGRTGKLLMRRRNDIVAPGLSSGKRLTGDIFIELHAKLRHEAAGSGRDRQDTFAGQICRIGNGRANVLRLEGRVIGEDALPWLARGEVIEHDGNRDPGTDEARSPMHDFRVCPDMLTPVHDVIL
jgi:hypothetical protein